MSNSRNGPWTTRRVGGEPRDVQLDSSGRKPVAMASWRAPLQPLRPGRCANCGGKRSLDGVCRDCNKTTSEDRELHSRLARKHGGGGLIRASERAADLGRHVAALKLATAAYHYGSEPLMARALRLQELEAVKELGLALREAQAWNGEDGAPGFVASIVAEILVKQGDTEGAYAVLEDGIGRDPDDLGLRLDRARVLLARDEPLKAVVDLRRCLEDTDLAPEAVGVLRDGAQGLLDAGRHEDTVKLIFEAGPAAHRDAQLCYQLGVAERKCGNLSAARRWLVHGLRLQPDHPEALPLLRLVENQLGIVPTADVVKS